MKDERNMTTDSILCRKQNNNQFSSKTFELFFFFLLFYNIYFAMPIISLFTHLFVCNIIFLKQSRRKIERRE